MRWWRASRKAPLATVSMVALGLATLVVALTMGVNAKTANEHASSHHGLAAAAMAGSVCSSSAEDFSSAFQREMDEGMNRMMADMHAPGYSGNVDVDFLAMMVPHHQGAVDMARLVLLHGRDPATRMLAEEIIASQTIEIQSMQRRLVALRQPHSVVAVDAYPLLGGTRGP
jgi:uncharacterized protein (DUF305 family)